MLVQDFHALLLGEFGKPAAVLWIREAILEYFSRYAASRLGAPPVDMHQPSAGHSAEPAARFDHENAAALTRGREGRGNTGGVPGVNAHVNGAVPRIGRTRRKAGTNCGRCTALEELTALHRGES